MVDDGSRSDYSSIHDLFFTPLKAEEESRLDIFCNFSCRFLNPIFFKSFIRKQNTNYASQMLRNTKEISNDN